jgi:hypothetical protein
MRLAAYVLAADPAWIERSLRSYYEVVDEIVVSYDRDGRSWTGTPIPVDDCVRRLQALDRDGKLRLAPGDFAGHGGSPMERDTAQRRVALAEAGRNADWVLQLDTDEVLPEPAALLDALRLAEELGLHAVEWPMRVLFRTLSGGRFLEVCARDGADRFEYPGPVAVRPGVVLTDARRAEGSFLRPVVHGDDRSLQVARDPEPGEVRRHLVEPQQAILHYSWAGSSSRVRRKVGSWGHNAGPKSLAFYHLRWKPAPLLWPRMHDFHPFARGLWPALKVSHARDDV